MKADIKKKLASIKKLVQTKVNPEKAVPKFAYIHIGKTGGTSVTRICTAAKDAGYDIPHVFGHNTKLVTVAQKYPDHLFSFTIRDSIERMISAFDSRMRQSRPSYTALWRPEEAISYLWFPSVHDFFDALLTNDERLKSAGLFAMHHFGHIRRGYEFHF